MISHHTHLQPPSFFAAPILARNSSVTSDRLYVQPAKNIMHYNMCMFPAAVINKIPVPHRLCSITTSWVVIEHSNEPLSSSSSALLNFIFYCPVLLAPLAHQNNVHGRGIGDMTHVDTLTRCRAVLGIVVQTSLVYRSNGHGAKWLIVTLLGCKLSTF